MYNMVEWNETLDLEEFFRLDAGDEGTGILVSLSTDVDKHCCSYKKM